jgi:hypothetical protein
MKPKKINLKLKLNKQTIANLNATEMEKIFGGADDDGTKFDHTCTSCNMTECNPTCPATCNNTCLTKYQCPDSTPEVGCFPTVYTDCTCA